MKLGWAVLFCFLIACKAPTPFVLGEETTPPVGCIEARERGVDC
jgi:hypothetical protein